MKEDTCLMTVAAIAAVLGGSRTLKCRVTTDADLHTLTREGLPVGTLPILAGELDVERKQLARMVGVSDRTLSRRLAGEQRLSAEESDRTMRVARVVAYATDVLGSIQKVAAWMKSPNRALEGQQPLELLDTDAGVRSVETVLGRIDYGIYS